MANQRSLFDIIGPVMIGPSSSHTAGAVRLGELALAIFGERPAEAAIELHGSFASTGRGHGTDLALTAGLLGMTPDDPGIRTALEAARAADLRVTFTDADLGEVHPNTARITLRSGGGRVVVVQGSSVGGADVILTRIDDFDVAISGELPVLIVEHHDQPGVIAAVSQILARHDANVASMEVSREMRGARALMVLETDQPVDDAAVGEVAQASAVTSVRVVPAV
ncbi:MAG: L-serine ammonia-lyase, iron-sulfur-dependent subunit beta [Coriobacteriia bacterium]|nr:L-serine ammonia-lyase, iron-sulfur-dependent subunit beta [Coriobacteriia bacterium]